MLYTLVSGTWNVLARLGLPALALLIMLTATRSGPLLIAAAAVGLAVLAAAAGLGLLVRSESFALRTGGALQRGLVVVYRLVRRQPPCNIPGSLLGFRRRAAALIAARGWRITAATAASHLILWLVLLACLRGVGLSQAQVPWQASLAAFAFVRLLTALPVTPGGLGITELGLVGTLAAGLGPGAGAQVTAAVLLYRAVTYPASYPPRRCRLPRVAARIHAPATAWATTAGRPQGAGPGVTACSMTAPGNGASRPKQPGATIRASKYGEPATPEKLSRTDQGASRPTSECPTNGDQMLPGALAISPARPALSAATWPSWQG